MNFGDQVIVDFGGGCSSSNFGGGCGGSRCGWLILIVAVLAGEDLLRDDAVD